MYWCSSSCRHPSVHLVCGWLFPNVTQFLKVYFLFVSSNKIVSPVELSCPIQSVVGNFKCYFSSREIKVGNWHFNHASLEGFAGLDRIFKCASFISATVLSVRVKQNPTRCRYSQTKYYSSYRSNFPNHPQTFLQRI